MALNPADLIVKMAEHHIDQVDIADGNLVTRLLSNFRTGEDIEFYATDEKIAFSLAARYNECGWATKIRKNMNGEKTIVVLNDLPAPSFYKVG